MQMVDARTWNDNLELEMMTGQATVRETDKQPETSRTTDVRLPKRVHKHIADDFKNHWTKTRQGHLDIVHSQEPRGILG